MRNLPFINIKDRSLFEILAIIALSSAFILFLSGCNTDGLVSRNDLGAESSGDSATGIESTLLHFAQMSDIHIVDDTDPLRVENIRLFPDSPYDLGILDSLIQSISRDQDRYSARIWDAVIRSINDTDNSDPLAFAIMTGDHTDTGLKNELRWFMEITDGILSGSLQDAIAEGAQADFNPAGLNIPWYAAAGNHDVDYQGAFNITPAILAILANYGDTGTLGGLPDAVAAYQLSATEPWWHGFANQPAISMENSYGYYSFDPNEIVHCIVLNTSLYKLAGEEPKDTFAGGILDSAQYDWMRRDIEANRDRLCIIFSHQNPVDGFFDWLSDVKADELMKTLALYDNVIAHFNGHVHINKIDPVLKESGKGGYWNVNTCAIIDWPQEWRNITIRDNGDGTGTITCRMVRHNDGLCLDIASGDPDSQGWISEGSMEDRNVELKFRIPAAVKDRILSL